MKKKRLVDSYNFEGKTSDILPNIFDKIEQKYRIKALYYARGPGSFMSIKVSYIFLKTFSITKDIALFGADGFEFNNNSYIKAHGTLYFLKKNGKIYTIKQNNISNIEDFKLPKKLDSVLFGVENEPLYLLPAV